MICTGLLFLTTSFAQQDSIPSTGVFNASLNYQSVLHYFGRTDSLKSNGLFPVISYKTKIGIYASGSFIFISNPAVPLHYTGTIAEIGYRLPENKTITGNVYYQQFLYKPGTTLQQASVKSQAGINTIYNNKIANVSLGGDVKFSEGNTDFGLTGGVDKMILFKDVLPKLTVAIDPTLTAYGGTQNFTTVVSKRNIIGLPTYSTVQYKNFNILALEASLPVVLVSGKFNFYFSPAFIQPQNQVEQSSTSGNSGLFYFSTGIGIRL